MIFNKKSKIYIAGHRGLVGSSIYRELLKQGYENIVCKTHAELDLTQQKQVKDFFLQEKFDMVFLAAAKVGGIYANSTYPADFIYQNLMIESNVIHSAYQTSVKRLIFLGSSCIYPKHAPQPMNERSLLTGSLEETNEPYAIAKIAGIKLCESYNRQYGTDFRSLMPTNLYGTNDNFHEKNSHVIPALIRRFHEAKKDNKETIVVWGSGKVRREFLYVDDMANASVHVALLDKLSYQSVTKSMLSHINVGTGEDVSIAELAEVIKKVTKYQGEIVWDKSMPDGAPQKLLDINTILKLGWQPTICLEDGIKISYEWYQDNKGNIAN